jgi:hypothetical protein
VLQVQVYLSDHRAETLRRVVAVAEAFARDNDQGPRVPAGGRQCRHRGGHQHRGAQGQPQMLLLVYAA